MATKAQQLQAMFARRREMEHMHIERTQAVNKYYDHWGKVTSRFENWTTPEYYKQAEEKLQRDKEEKQKQKQLEERRKKLAELLENEQEQYNAELKDRQRNRKVRSVSTTTLEKINDNLKEQQAIRRKLELEAKLYGKWRHGVDDENLIFESKSDHEVIAKLNWLDKQVENQLEREKEEMENRERNLRLQAEQNRAEELHKQRQEIRQREIEEIRALQETHMEQLQEHQKECEHLKEAEQKIRENIEELEKELELLDESYAVLQQPSNFGGAYNLTKIKVFMRKRSEVYRNHIKLCICILERTSAYASKSDNLLELKKKLSQKLDSEMYTLTQIDGMYESEAKYNLHRCEELWQSQAAERYKELKDALNMERNSKGKLLNDTLERQNELLDIRTTHLNAIESTSEKLKQLIKEQEESPRGVLCVCTPRSADEEDAKKSADSTPRSCQLNLPSSRFVRPQSCQTTASRVDSYHKDGDNSGNRYVDNISKTFRDLNLDVWETMAPSPRELDNQRLEAQRPLRVVTADTAERPRFGRKRVAWT
ncbi:trichoplein keratin filament-binding protein [Musca vetustissima]|uniref:trichoplein keratin filament-binding protein n=1 Tax=Musca vetustissima TaxID=27455 RepID=UPI002AB68165|nr:trichoplein keratin filament-binding protein [Musca vetustissima]